jgi:DNA-binding transcriptional LysR family regulator
MPSLVALRCFEAAARLESFSRAADELHLTHGAISRAVRSVEEDLGAQLFERRNRRVFLNAAGRLLFDGVHAGLGQMARAAEAVRQQVAGRPLLLSCEPTLLMRWLIPRWGDFQARYPQHTVHLVAGGGTVEWGRGIDLAIRRNDFDWGPNVQMQPLCAEHMGPVCHPTVWRSSLRCSPMAALRFVAMQRSCIARRVSRPGRIGGKPSQISLPPRSGRRKQAVI